MMEEKKGKKKSLSVDDPNIEAGLTRFKRTLWAWAALSALMGILSYLAVGRAYPLASLPWFTTAVILIVGSQPAYLAVVSVQWGLSLIHLIPGLALYLGPDPLTFVLDPGVFETAVIIAVRVFLMVTSFNQFLFYRILYGTGQMSGLGDDLPAVPEVVPNRSNLLAQASRALGLLALMIALVSGAMNTTSISIMALSFSLILGMYSIGLGVGAAFSPTDRRGAALTGIGLGAIAFLMALIFIRNFRIDLL